MKCKNCEREWSAANNGLLCPFCGTSAALPPEEVDRLKSEAGAAAFEKRFDAAARLWFDAAEQGDAQAQYEYAQLLLDGRGVKLSTMKAAVWLKSAARLGYHAASFRLSQVLKNMSLPEETCFFWVRIAAAQGNRDAAHQLARAYEKGTGIASSLPLSLYWYIQSSGAGNEEATLDLVRYYTEDGTELSRAHARYFLSRLHGRRLVAGHYQRKLGDGEAVAPALAELQNGEEFCALGKLAEEGQGEPAIAVAMYRLSAERGCAEGQYRLGLCYESGTGTEKKIPSAASCYKEAAEAGYSPAMTRLGLLLRDTAADGNAISSAVAFNWIQKAAEAGEPEAEYALGCAYFGGTLTKRDLLAARDWFRKAAAHHHEEAEARLAEMENAMAELCRRAKEAKEAGNLPETFRYYKMAADMGHRGARCSVGSCYQTGTGVKRNGAMAVRYYRLAAMEGSLPAIHNLGLCYLHGDGIPVDYRMAKALLSKAAEAGYGSAADAVAEIDRSRQRKIARKLYAASAAIYRRGDVDNAIRFRLIAAGMGDARSMFLLGCHYEFGDGLPYDQSAADQWYRKAVDSGFQAGSSRLKNGFIKERKRRIDPKKK